MCHLKYKDFMNFSGTVHIYMSLQVCTNMRNNVENLELKLHIDKT